MKVTMRTEVEPGGVYYSVHRNDERVWSKRVDFGHDKRHRAGGSAFVAAAQEQEHHARLAWEVGDDRPAS